MSRRKQQHLIRVFSESINDGMTNENNAPVLLNQDLNYVSSCNLESDNVKTLPKRQPKLTRNATLPLSENKSVVISNIDPQPSTSTNPVNEPQPSKSVSPKALECKQRRSLENASKRKARLESYKTRYVTHRLNETNEEKQTRQRKARANKQRLTNKYLAAARSTNSDGTEHYLGKMDKKCEHCEAKFFAGEMPPDGRFTFCCQKGTVKLDPLQPNAVIQGLLDGTCPNSKLFFENIRQYNSALAFASMDASYVPQRGWGPSVYRIHGQIYHRISALHPMGDNTPKYAQLYILDEDAALKERMNNNPSCDAGLMTELANILTTVNVYAKSYKMMHEVEIEEQEKARVENRPQKKITMAIQTDKRDDQRRYNIQQENEIAVVFEHPDGEPPFERGIIVHDKSARATQIIPSAVLDKNVDPMCYPLLFPNGEFGWHPEMLKVNVVKQSRITLMEYYSYRLMIRDAFNPCIMAKRLTQQFTIDAYVKAEANRLNWIKKNQDKLRVDQYKGLLEHIANKANNEGVKAGRAFVLPSTFQGSPRNMQQLYQDAMSIVRKFGKPDLFITMTCNPMWREIQECLLPNQKAIDRPEIVARVFYLKVKELLKLIKEDQIFGAVDAWVYTIEFQKRGLPHIHLLLILSPENKLKDSDDIDDFISAEIPNKEINPRLHEIVTKCMIHGPCGNLNVKAPCMEGDVCTKNFPKEFRESTVDNQDGYPLYRRRNSEAFVNKNGIPVDNRWVVSYNPFLMQKLNCHINVEHCASIASVKYLFKYVYKGYDCANLEFKEVDGERVLIHDEVKSFVDARYICAVEACWRLFGFKMHDKSHTIYRLGVHVEDGQSITFEDGQEEQAVAKERDTTLTGWFKLNAKCPDARRYLYTELPYFYVWGNGKWTERKQGHDKVIGRMYPVSPSDFERYCLRLILLQVKGAQSFKDLRTVNGILYPTFKQAAAAMGLLEDDLQWSKALADAITFKMPAALRQLFAHICLYGPPSDPMGLWEQYKQDLIEDLLLKYNEADSLNMALLEIEQTFKLQGKSCKDFDLPTPINVPGCLLSSSFDKDAERLFVETNLPKLNHCQKVAYDEVIYAVEHKDYPKRCYFWDGIGGAGKTFTYNVLMSTLRSKDLEVCAAASTGIAANLLKGGLTVHALFKLPVPFDDGKTSGATESTLQGKRLKNASLILIDETTMLNKLILNEMDRHLKEIMRDNSRPFGGKVLILGGDWRQILCVVKNGNRVTTVGSCLQKSKVWNSFKQVGFFQNMRTDPDQLEFADWLLKLGNGDIKNVDNLAEDIIEMPSEFLCTGSLVEEIYGTAFNASDVSQFAKKAILCPTNDDTLKLNDDILKRLEGDERLYQSIDTIKDGSDEDRMNFPEEFLHEQTPSGMPTHNLCLKIGAIIMLLRNLNTKRGLCNGVRLICKSLADNVIYAEVLTGSAVGQMVFIPRITLAPTDANLPFILQRRQFPIRVSFAMTINKSQGQTFDKVGIYLSRPVFSHGQLYVAFSRATSRNNVRVKILDTAKQGALVPGLLKVFTKNVVYPEVLTKF